MDAAVARECLAVRNAAGVLDASTLGKIEVVGPDAAAFLDRMYTNRMSTLPVGSIRYGFMLGLDGMVADDGVAMRLGEDRFLVTTTTGNAAMVLDRFEEWLQTEWPDLRVYCTSVTEQWTDVAVAGPKAREVLAAARHEHRPRTRGVPVHDVPRRRGGGRLRARRSGELHRRALVRDPGRRPARPRALGSRDRRPVRRSASRPTAPRRCTSSAPRRAS